MEKKKKTEKIVYFKLFWEVNMQVSKNNTIKIIFLNNNGSLPFEVEIEVPKEFENPCLTTRLKESVTFLNQLLLSF